MAAYCRVYGIGHVFTVQLYQMFYCYFIHLYVFTVISIICGIFSSVISFFFKFVCVMLQFQLCCYTAQLHCNTSAIVIGD